MIIATHDGTFHADETTACAIISYIYENCRIIRSRDPRILEGADLIIDVSGINDARHYDHHSPAFTQVRPNGVRYATAGLMWQKFGQEFLRKLAKQEYEQMPPEEILKAAFERIDREIMQLVDLDDNGQLTEYAAEVARARTPEEEALRDRLSELYGHMPGIPYIVAMLNLPGATENLQQQSFSSCVKMLRSILASAALNALCTESSIARVTANYHGGELLILKESLPWTEAVLSCPEVFRDCLLAVFPDRRMHWRVQSLPVSRAQRFKNRLSAPKAWRGLNFEELDRATGLSHMTFVHRSGFVGGAECFEDNLKLARLWLKLGKAEQAAETAQIKQAQQTAQSAQATAAASPQPPQS